MSETTTSAAKCTDPSGCWKSSSGLISILALAGVLQTEGFHSPPTRRTGICRRPHQNHRSFQVSGLCQSLQKSHQARSSPSKFFVASSTGRSLNNDNESTGYLYNPTSDDEQDDDDEEEIPWECIIDPNSSDECMTIIEEYHHRENPTGVAWSKRTPEDERVTLRDKVAMGATLSSCILAFVFLLMKSGPGSWRFFLAGGLCAAASHAIPTPIDVVKTRKQVDTDLEDLSFVKATQKIIKDEGVGGLLTGLGPTLWGYLMEGSMKFGVYEVLKPATSRILASLAEATSLAFLSSQLIAFIVCGVVAGTAASIVLCPMEALRIRLVSEPEFAPKGWIQGGRRMIRREGVLSLWRGIAPQIFKQVPYTVTKNVSFDYFTKYAYRLALGYGMAMNHGTKFAIPVVSAILASILSCISSQPGDTLLSLVSARQGEKRSTAEIAREIMDSDKGIRGFFVGLNCRFYHVGIIVTLQLVLYDFLKRLCGGIATGSAGH